MLIYMFTEHYPNPYKPYYDTQFIELLRRGQEIRVFAVGSYLSTVNENVRSHGLDKMVTFYPTTLRTLPRFFLPAAAAALRHPCSVLPGTLRAFGHRSSLKHRVGNAFRATRLPPRQPDLCFIHNLATASHFTFLSRRYRDAVVAMHFHGGEVGKTSRVAGGKRIFEAMDIVFTNTRFSRDQAIERGCAPEKIVLCPVGFDLEEYAAPPARRYRPDGPLRLVSVGRISEEKGYIHALQGIHRLVGEGRGNLSYRIIGHGYDLADLQDYVKRAGLESIVTFVGERSRSEVIEELRRSDVLLLPSLATATWAETQACVVQEAMLMRNLVITTRAGGVPESIPEEMARFSVDVRDPAGIAARVTEIQSLSQEALEALGEAGRRFVVRNYGVREITSRWLGAVEARRPAAARVS